MTNKNPVFIFFALLVLVAGGAVVWRLTVKSHTANPTVQEAPQVSENTTPAVTPDTSSEPQPGEVASASTTDPTPTGQVAPTPETSASKTACVRNYDQQKAKAGLLDIKNRSVTITVKDFGTITAVLYDREAPKTVENFLRLTQGGYYNCITFHRVAKGFVIQSGDPTGTGAGGESVFGSEFADEINANSDTYKTGYKKGVLAMANRGPNTNTSQFFIMLADTPLPANYTIFGKVTAGLDVVDKIGQVPIDPGPFGPTDGKPKQPVMIEKLIIK